MSTVAAAATLPDARALLLHGRGGLDAFADALPDGIATVAVESVARVSEASARRDLPVVLVLDEALTQDPDLAAQLSALPPGIVAVAGSELVAARLGSNDRVLLTLPAAREAAARALQIAFQHAALRLAAARMERELNRTRAELRELNRIGMALMTERDPERLLVRILDQAMALTDSDAGSLYLVEKDEQGKRRLRFKLSRNASLPDLPFMEFTLPIDPYSIAGYAAHTGEILGVDDAYELSEETPFRFNRGFDERFGYRTKSMLVVPMKDHRDDVVGVLQLINRKRSSSARITDEESARAFVQPYSAHELELVHSLAGQAAVSIENSQLYAEIQRLFDSFVKAAVTAIDQRDPTTAGHSLRVASLTVDLAQVLQRNPPAEYRGVHFTAEQMRELRYASLLHDFGKVGVREEVLVKAKKLPPFLFERVESRFDLIRRTLEAEYHRRRADFLNQNGRRAFAQVGEAWDREFAAQMEELDRFHQAVRTANEPTVLEEQAATILDAISERSFTGVRGETLPYLNEDELHFLQIPRGTLDERERLEIESHVEQTFRFLQQIPWTDDLRQVASIAYGHHEKLNGRGYPRRLTGEDIPVQTRMMTIADIFDALTARDRPYKKAVPHERALDILNMEARDGMLDKTLVDMLIESEVYRKILEKDWTEL